MKVISTVVAAALVAANSPDPAGSRDIQRHQSRPVSEWSERGVFVFGGGLVFDFLYKRFQGGPWGFKINDCSNSTHFCMASRTFNIALPRSCDRVAKAKPGDVWSVGAVELKVLQVEEATTVPAYTTLYLGNESTPEIVYEYDPKRGVTAILWDDPGPGIWKSSTGINFVALAKAGTLSRWQYGSGTDPRKANRVNRLVTLDPFGKCESGSAR